MEMRVKNLMFWRKQQNHQELLAETDSKLKEHLCKFLLNKNDFFTEKAFVTFEYEKQCQETQKTMLGRKGQKYWRKFWFRNNTSKISFQPIRHNKEVITQLTFRQTITESTEGNLGQMQNFRLPKITNEYSPEKIIQTTLPQDSSVFEKTVVNYSKISEDIEPRYPKIVRPAEPIDILWENLDDNQWLRKKIFSYAATTLLLGICFGFIFASTLWQKDLKEQGKTPEDDDYLAFLIMTRAAVILITVANLALKRLIPRFTKYEKNYSVTEYQANLAVKLTFAALFNSALLVLLVYLTVGDRYGTPSLIEEITEVIIVALLIPPVDNVVTVIWQQYCAKCLERRKLTKLKQQESSAINQLQYNLAWQGPTTNLATRYGEIIYLYLLVMFYGPIFPLAYLIAALGFFLMYWSDKFLLLRFQAYPQKLYSHLHNYMIAFIPFGVLLSCCSCLLFHYDYNAAAIIPCAAGIIVSFIIIILIPLIYTCVKNSRKSYKI